MINTFLKSFSKTIFIILCPLLLMVFSNIVRANNPNLTLEVIDEEFTLHHYPATGKQLVLYVAPGYGFNPRGFDMAKALSELGIEVWMVDLAENFFLPHGNKTIRTFSGKYVASIIEQAHSKTGKNVTLFTSSYGAIPVLRGARQWQLNNKNIKQAYLNGAIMFSPELYLGVPALGIDPDFVPITSSTNIPIMIYQSEYRNNRWQLDNVIGKLEKGNATVYRKIMPGITSFFYRLDTAPNTLKALRETPNEIPRVIKLLESTPTPLIAAELAQPTKTKQTGMDIKLRAFKGNSTPLPLDLMNINGEHIVRNDYRNKITVVNFWATWCPPCVEEIPSLNRLSAKMKGNEFELISVNFAEEKKVISEFLKKVNVEFPVLLDEKGHTSAAWNTIALPSTFIIGPDGKIAYGVNAAIEWDSPEVIQALKQLAQK